MKSEVLMTEIILPIQTDPFNRIFNYTKNYEYRKKLPINLTKVYLYLSKTGIMGYITPKEILTLPVKDLVNLADSEEQGSGSWLKDYYKSREYGTAISIAKRYMFTNPIQMPFVPQSYVYLDRYHALKLLLEDAN